MGLRGKPTYRVVVIDSRKARDGRYIESVGSYDPRTKLLNMKPERVQHWVGQGAQPSDKVRVLIKKYGASGTHVAVQQAAFQPPTVSLRPGNPGLRRARLHRVLGQ